MHDGEGQQQDPSGLIPEPHFRSLSLCTLLALGLSWNLRREELQQLKDVPLDIEGWTDEPWTKEERLGYDRMKHEVSRQEVRGVSAHTCSSVAASPG